MCTRVCLCVFSCGVASAVKGCFICTGLMCQAVPVEGDWVCTLLVPMCVFVCVVCIGSLHWGVFNVHTAGVCQMGVYMCVCVCVCV